MDHCDTSQCSFPSVPENHAYKALKDCLGEPKAISSATLRTFCGFCPPGFKDIEQNIPNISAIQTGIPELKNIPLHQIPVQQSLNQTRVTSQSVDQKTYNKRHGAANIKGQLYKMHMSMLFLLQGLSKKKNGEIDGFHLAADMQEAGDFKDVVFKCRKKSERDQSGTKKAKITFLHTRHVDYIGSKKIALDVLATNPKEKGRNLDLNLHKYFSSYRKIKKLFLETEDEHPLFQSRKENVDFDFVLYTNALPTSNDCDKVVRRIDEDIENILHLNGHPETYCYYQIIFDNDDNENTRENTESLKKRTEIIINALENSSDCRKLAKDLAKSVFLESESSNAQLIHQSILKEYHIALSETVIEKTTIKAKTGKFKTSFLDCDECLSKNDKDFRNMFFEEARNITAKSEDQLKEELRSKNIKLSDKFGENTGNKEDARIHLLPNDHVCADEVREFLEKFKIFVGQPGEEQLVEIIKEKIKTIFKVEQGDVDSIFVAVKTKVERWWKEQNQYLTETNRFFEDSVRISVFFNVKRPAELFTGRKQQLGALHSLMQLNPEETTAVAITGLGGIGKTELVRQYVYKHCQDYDNNIICINAESYETLVASFRRLAQYKLKINTKNVDGNEKDIKYVVEEVYMYFTKRKSLFIFDNAEKFKTTEAQDGGIDLFLPTFPKNGKTYILITSRSQKWENFKIFPLDVFTKEEAIEYIKRALNTDVDEIEAQQLSEIVQRFPLALKQAVAYIREENKPASTNKGLFTIANYVEEYKIEGSEEKLLDFRPLDISDYGRTTYITLKITLQKIDKMNYGDEALGVLNIMAYFVSDSISTKIFLQRIPAKRELGSALELLKQYSIIGLDQGEANIHRLMQQVLRAELKRCNKEKDVLKDALHVIENGMTKEREMNNKYVSHAISVWTHASKYAELVKRFSGLPCEILSVLDNSVRYEEACLFGKKTHVLLENILGIDNFYTLLLLNAVAVVHDHSGKYDEALKAYENVVSKFTQILGCDHFCTLAVKQNMAGSLKNQGKYEDALQTCEEVLEKRKKILGDSDPNTLITMNDIAILLKNLGKYKESLKVYQVVLQIREEKLGSSHQDTLMTKHGMALVHYLDRKYDEAYEVYQEVLKKRIQVLGPDHPDTLMTKNNLASVLCCKHRYNDALPMFQELVKKTEKVLGSDHPHTFLAKAGVGNSLYEMGCYDEALVAFQEVLDQRQRVLGLTHPQTLQAQHDKALILMNQGKYKEAMLAYSDLLEKEICAFGSENPVTLVTQHNTALILHKMGKYGKALQLYQELLEKNKRLRGVEHPDTLETQHNIACVLHDQGNYNEALRIYEEVLEKRSKILDSNDMAVLKTKNNIATVLCDIGNYDALKIYEEVLQESQKVLDPNHPDTLTVERNIAGIMHRLGRFDEALTAYQEVLEKGKQILSPDHPDNLLTLSNLAGVLDDKGYFHLALKNYKEVLNKRKKIFGSNHPDTLTAKNLIALVLSNQGNHSEALKIYLDVLHERKEILGADHPDTLHTQNGIAELFDSLENYQESSELYQEVLNKRTKILGAKHPDTLRTMNDMARSLLKQGKYNEAISAFQDILDKRKNVLGLLHPSTLLTQNDIGRVLHCQGNYTEAMNTYEQVLNTRQKVLGLNHPDVLTTLTCIAALLDDQGHYDLSLKAHREVLDKQKQLFGPNLPVTLTTENNMAGVFFNMKLYEEALKMYRDVLNKKKQFWGPDNPYTLLTQNNIAAVLHAQGNYEDALKIYEQVLEKRKLFLPPDHPDILMSLSYIAEVLDDKQCFDLSLKMHQDVLVIREKVLGSCHPDTLRSKNHVAEGLCKQGNYEEALKIYREVLMKREKMLGSDNVSVLATQSNVAVVLHYQENYEEALEIYLKVLNKRKKILGTNHPETLCTMHNIATVLYYCSNYDEALKIDKEVLERRKHVFGPHHPSTISTRNRLASILSDQGKYYDVLETCLDILDKEKVLELYHSNSMSNGNVVLHVVASRGEMDCLQYLIENGADVLSRNEHNTLLHDAVNNNNSEVLKMILNQIKEKYENITLYIDAPDKDGDTPLMWAAEVGNISSSQILLEYGANVDARNKNGWTALHWAAKGGHKEIIEHLLNSGANPNIENKTGRTALHFAYETLDHDSGDQENLKTIIALLLSVTE